jgi:glutamate-1-semialdehyde aminotransferase/thioesterase domain-containing protein/acyl carrier protein
MASNERRERLVHKIRETAQDLSGVPPETITENASFLELGFDSLFLTQLSAACQRIFGIRITFRQLFSDLKSVAALGAYLDEKLPPDDALPGPVSVDESSAPVAVQAGPTVSAPSVAVPAAALVSPPPVLLPVQAPPAETASFGPPAVEQQALRVARLEGVLLQQLELMSAQLRFLRGMPPDIGVRSPRAQASPAVLPAIVPAVVASMPAPENAVMVPPLGSEVHTKSTETTKEQPIVKMLSGFGPSGIRSSGSQPLPPRQQKHLERLIKNYTQRTAGSKARTQRYRNRLADPRTAAGFNPLWKEMVYPIWIQRSSGSKLWDVDGNEYIDLLNGFGPIFLGHAPTFVTKAIAEQLSRGFEIGPQTLLVGEVAEMICQLTGMDRASFTCSGSEAVQAAMRLSRTFTGRDKVVVFSRDYHGNFDQVLVRQANHDGQLRTMPSASGIPFQSVDDTYVMEYGTEESLDLIKKHAEEIAAVLVEPVQSRRPDFQPKEFLHELRRITHEESIVLVFDEVVTGFRCAPGGAQAHFGIEADLATYGKVIGGGMPIGVVAGRSWLMDIFDGGFWRYGDASFPEAGVTFFAGTFIRHPLTIAAAHATLKYLIQEGPALQKRVSDRAGKFVDQINAVFKKYELKIELPRFTSQMYLRNEEHADLAPLLGTHLRYRGVHILEGFPCYMTDAHTDDDVEQLVRAFTDSVEAMVEDGIFGNRSKLPIGRLADLRWYSAPAICSPMPQQPCTAQPSSRIVEYPSTDLQREMWIAARMRPEASAASNGTNVVELVGEINVSALEAAIAEVVKRHQALRATFSDDGNRVIVQLSMALQLRCHDLSELTPSDASFRLTGILAEDARQIFDLSKGPLASFQLIKLSAGKHLLVFTAQMIICDGWGYKVVLEEISRLYSGFVEGREPAMEAATQMEEYASWQVKERDSAEGRKSEEFWLSQFTTLPAPFDLPTTDPRPRIRSYEAARHNLRLTPQLYQSIKRVARELGSTPFALLLTAFSTWLYRLSGKNDFAVGVPFAGQGELGFSAIVGQCVHTLPFRFELNDDASFSDELARTQKLILDAQEHWRSNLGALIQRLNIPSDPSRIPLAPVIFNLDPALTGVQFSGCTSRITSGPRFYFHYDLGFNLVDEGETLLVECDYNSNLFDYETVRYWVAGFQTLVEAIAWDGKQSLGQLPVLGDNAPPKRRNPSRSTPVPLSGKISPATSGEYLAPRNETEEHLARLWCATLNLERMSRSANFFELGGQSLAAVSLFAKIEEEFGKKLPLATLLNAPTIEALATVLQGKDSVGSWSPLVGISPSGWKPPVFLVHGAGGNVLLYRSLAQYLAPDFPLYGLQSMGLDGKSQPLRTIEEMADCYVRELRTVQPKGPYYLGGYCLGGTIAYEMAQILRREGEEIPLVAMLDTYNYSLALRVNFRSFLYQKAKFHLANMSTLRPRQILSYLREKIRLGVGGELANLKTSMPGSSCLDGVSRATSGAEAAVQALNDYAAEHYNPSPYPGVVTLFKPRFNYKFYPDPNMGWGDLAAELDIVEVAVNPHSMLLEPYVKVLATQLKERIEFSGAALGSYHPNFEIMENAGI